MHKVLTIGVLFVLIFGFTATVYTQEVDREILPRHYQAPMFAQLSDQTHLFLVDDVEAGEQNREKPSLSAGRIVAGGCLGGCGGAYIVGAIANQIVDPQNDVGFYTWMAAGYAIGTACGVWAAGMDFRNKTGYGQSLEKGSFRGTLVGSLLGYGIGASMLLGGFYWLDHEPLAFGGYIIMWLAPPIGAIIGFNRTRRYDSTAEFKTALINFGDDQMSLAVPRVYFRPDPLGKGNLSQSVDLLRMRF